MGTRIAAVARAGAVVLALAGGVVAQEPMPRGWFVEEFESSGLTDIYLYWLEPAVGGQVLQFSCQENWPDVVVSAFMDEPAREPTRVELVGGGARVALEMVGGGVAHDRYSAGGVTRFTPEVTAIVSGQFSVEVDGVEQGRYSAKGAGEDFARVFAACPPDGDGS